MRVMVPPTQAGLRNVIRAGIAIKENTGVFFVLESSQLFPATAQQLLNTPGTVAIQLHDSE